MIMEYGEHLCCSGLGMKSAMCTERFGGCVSLMLILGISLT